MRKSTFRRHSLLLCAAILVLLIGTTLTVFHGWRSPSPLPEPESTTASSAEKPTAPSTPDQDLAATPHAQHNHPTTQQNPPTPDPTDLPLTPDFIDRHTTGQHVSFTLPDGSTFEGQIELSERDPQGLIAISGRTLQPFHGTFFIQRQTAPGVAGPFVGNILFDEKQVAWKIEPDGDEAHFVKTTVHDVICYSYPIEAFDELEEKPQEMPADHPFPDFTPEYQSIISLQSLPGATGVIYLDFDGEKGPFPGWGDFDAAPAGFTNEQVFEFWQRVASNFQPFNLNVTTDRRVFDEAPPGRRQQVIVTPTNTPRPGAGGVAMVGSYNYASSRPCWVFMTTSRVGAIAAVHEIGHTLGLMHWGRKDPHAEEYYYGHTHQDSDISWAPIMGVGYHTTLNHWTKGEFKHAKDIDQDDLYILTLQNNDLEYRIDDHGHTLETSSYLEIFPDNSVNNEGIIETSHDIDSFRFKTTGGSISLTVSPPSLNPVLDITAELIDASNNTLIASDAPLTNPTKPLEATINAQLPAGEYLLRVTGTGRGNPLEDGYSDYGSIGAYKITGTVENAVKPERFSIAENSANGTSLGTITPRENHGSNSLTWSISSGNEHGLFTIHPSTGALTVANSSLLDYESFTSGWIDSANIELFITITDHTNPALTETIRTVVKIQDVNEPPVASNASLTILQRTAPGTELLKIDGSDPDYNDYPTYSITAGNEQGIFAIDSRTGLLSIASQAESTGTFPLSITLTDQGSPALSTTITATVTIQPVTSDATPGSIVRTYFNNIAGTSVSNLTSHANFPNNPDSEEFLTSFDGTERGDSFGSTIRGYLIPPVSGTYQFWIASDDDGELHLSTNSNPSSATKIASVSGWSSQYEWNKQPSQKSTTFELTAGQPYYIEARHKEGGGGDHVAVAWTGPGIDSPQVILGLYLAPYYQNYAPKLAPGTFRVRKNAIPNHIFGSVLVFDVNEQDEFWLSLNKWGHERFNTESCPSIFRKSGSVAIG